MLKQKLPLVCLVFAFGFGHAFAHDNFRVIGTLTKHEESKIEVKSRDGKVTALRLDKQTVITRNNEPVDVAALAIGLSVVIDAYGDTPEDSLALEIRIVPPIAAAP
jgi:hypothetical protein